MKITKTFIADSLDDIFYIVSDKDALRVIRKIANKDLDDLAMKAINDAFVGEENVDIKELEDYIACELEIDLNIEASNKRQKRYADNENVDVNQLENEVKEELEDYVENPNSSTSNDLEEAVKELEQAYDSAGTSLNQIPALFKKLLEDNKFTGNNFDNGGGKFDTASEWLQSHGYGNFVYDKYNRDEEHNKSVLDRGDYETSTIANVLNVIKEDEVILDVLRRSKEEAPITYISVYEGDKSGVGRMTKNTDGTKCWQRNMRLKDYVPLIEQVFDNVKVWHGYITAWDDDAVEAKTYLRKRY